MLKKFYINLAHYKHYHRLILIATRFEIIFLKTINRINLKLMINDNITKNWSLENFSLHVKVLLRFVPRNFK